MQAAEDRPRRTRSAIKWSLWKSIDRANVPDELVDARIESEKTILLEGDRPPRRGKLWTCVATFSLLLLLSSALVEVSAGTGWAVDPPLE